MVGATNRSTRKRSSSKMMPATGGMSSPQPLLLPSLHTRLVLAGKSPARAAASLAGSAASGIRAATLSGSSKRSNPGLLTATASPTLRPPK